MKKNVTGLFGFTINIFFHLNKVILVFIFLKSFCIYGQFDPNYDYNFHPPLSIPLVLAANFGELRTNHFHTGLDFKTNRQIGYSIHSVDDGYVARIKVSPYGYGHVVYINHYNGLTSVYAHLDEFTGQLKDLAKHRQWLNRHFEFEYMPSKDSIKVKKGEEIALSGNTGGSTAPHLHFEIRDTKTQHALNPLLFGFDIKDTRKPTIRGMKVYALTPEGYRIPNKSRTLYVGGGNGNHFISGNTITIPSNFCSPDGGIGFSFDAIDQLDGADNVCGIFKAYLIIDGDTIYEQEMTEIAFESNRYINCHKDYEEFHQRRKHFQKTFKTIHNPLPIYIQDKNNGIFKGVPGENYTVEYLCVDTKGNKANLKFTLVIQHGEINDLSQLYSPSISYLFPEKNYHYQNDDFLINFPPGLVYEPTPLIIKQANGYQFGDSRVPIQEKYKVMMRIDSLVFPSEKYVITRKNHLGQIISEPTHFHQNWLTTWAKDFGFFSISTDIVAPVIHRKNFNNQSNVKGKKLIWYASDNLSGIVDYDVYINGEWTLLNYEPKQGAYFMLPQPHINGPQTVQVRFEDACGNVTTEEYILHF